MPRSIVRGSKANKPEVAKELRELVNIAQWRVAVSLGTPINLLSLIPSPLKTPTMHAAVSLSATLIIRRF